MKELLTVWFPLRVLKYIGLDIPYATKVLGWEFELDAFGTGFHFHRKNGVVVRPADYGAANQLPIE